MKWLFRLIGLILVLVLVVIVGISLVPAEKIANFAACQLSEQTGHEVVFQARSNPSSFRYLAFVPTASPYPTLNEARVPLLSSHS